MEKYIRLINTVNENGWRIRESEIVKKYGVQCIKVRIGRTPKAVDIEILKSKVKEIGNCFRWSTVYEDGMVPRWYLTILNQTQNR